MSTNADPTPSPSAHSHGHETAGLLARIGRYSATHSKRVLLVWVVVVAVAAPLAITLTSALSGAGWEAQGSTAQKVRDEIRRDFPELGAEAAVVAYRQKTPIATDPSGVEKLLDALANSPGTDGVIDPLRAPAESGLRSPDGLAVLIPVRLESRNDAELPESAGKVMQTVSAVSLPAGAEADTTGEWAVWHDFNKSNEEALHTAELLSAIPTMLLLFIAFGSVLAAGLPMLIAVAGIAVGFAALHVATFATPMSVWSMNFSMMIGLAVGIDYCLFIVTRHREERVDGRNAADAIAGTLATAGKAVFLSALTVVLSLAAIFLVPVMVFRAMALGMILAVLATAAASLTLLPAVLVALGDRALSTRSSRRNEEKAEGRWAKWTAAAMRRPGATLAVGLGLLLVLAGPALGMRLGMPAAAVVDRGAQSRDGYDAVTAAFGPGAAAPLLVTVPAADAPNVVDIATKDPGVVAAQTVTSPAPSGRVVVRIIPTTAVDAAATSKLIDRLRNELARNVPQAQLGGPGSQNTDLTKALTGTAPLAIGAIMGVAFLLLLVVFRSPLIALTSILFNLIGVGASFGFASLVFQHGFGASLLGIEHQGFVNAWAPLFFFALLFGLSMDYQLFLLAAIKERHDSTGDARLAVREGIARTGKPITNAALIMIVVFIAFGVTGPIPPTELGITLALAVFLDATVIRMMLVPSLLGMLGERAWRLPSWLDRRLPHVTFTH